VKGVLIRHGQGVHVGMGAACPPIRSAADVGRALSALAIACEAGGREIGAMGDEKLARRYLALNALRPASADRARGSEGEREDRREPISKEERSCLQQM
jgi:hypothetical protein